MHTESNKSDWIKVDADADAIVDADVDADADAAKKTLKNQQLRKLFKMPKLRSTKKAQDTDVSGTAAKPSQM